jgi:hypothetical protein
MQIVFFKRQKPRHFEYKPRYYDEEKERREKRQKLIDNPETRDTSMIKMEIDRRWRRIDRTNRAKAKGINLLVYIIIVGLIVYFMFYV